MTRTKTVDGIKKPLTSKEEADRDAEEMRTANEKAIYAAEQYKRDRSSHYPSVGDQFDALWKQLNQDRLNGKELIQPADDELNRVLAVKAKYPKPE